MLMVRISVIEIAIPHVPNPSLCHVAIQVLRKTA